MAVAVDDLITVQKAAEILAEDGEEIKPSDVYNMIYQQKLPSFKVGHGRMVKIADVTAEKARRAASKVPPT